MMIRTVFIFLILSCTLASEAQPIQNIRGVITETGTAQPVGFASVAVSGMHSIAPVVSDSAGHFIILAVPVGRYDLFVSVTGYEPYTVLEVVVGSAKEVVLDIQLQKRFSNLGEIVIKAGVATRFETNQPAGGSAQSLQVEQMQRYAGGFDDPARLVGAFAGVAGNTGNNALIVRGNNPQSLQWKMEGIEIPAPNHLGDMRVFGGGGLTGLSAQLLGRATFFPGAMPAEYNNALSGVLDMYLRNGNSQQREHTLQVGVIGIDAASEGPFKKGGQSSYLFNYRYSTLALVAPLLADNAGGIKYQDLSFKLHFPTRKAGVFSVWGMGLRDRMDATAKQDISDWVYDDDREHHRVKLYMGVAGITHGIRLNARQYLSSTAAATTNGIFYPTERLDSNFQVDPKNLLDNKYFNLTLTSSINSRLSNRHQNKTGFTVTQMQYDLQLQNFFLKSSERVYVAKEKGSSSLLAGYTQSHFKLGGSTGLHAGVNAQLFTLNKTFAVEPRISIRQRLSSRHLLRFAYGLHSRLERLNYYFVRDVEGHAINKKMGFTRSHHVVLGYDWNIPDSRRLIVEVYYQYLFKVPVITDSSYSLLNQQNEWFMSAPLSNKGAGRNTGIDMSFDKRFSKSYYYLVTVSLFNARYKGGDNIWHNTRYNRNYAINFLIGREWLLGKNHQNMMGVNARFNYQGGDWHAPVNEPVSIEKRTVIYDETKAFTLQYPAAFTTHLTISYTINKKAIAHRLALKIINLTQYQEYIGFRYNYLTNQIDVNREPVVIPNLSYRIDF